MDKEFTEMREEISEITDQVYDLDGEYVYMTEEYFDRLLSLSREAVRLKKKNNRYKNLLREVVKVDEQEDLGVLINKVKKELRGESNVR